MADGSRCIRTCRTPGGRSTTRAARVASWQALGVIRVEWWDPATARSVAQTLDDPVPVDELVGMTLGIEHGGVHPALTFIRNDGSSLSIASDGSRAFLVWINGLEEAFQSVGVADSGPDFAFSYGGEWSEAKPRDLVPLASGIASVRAFLATGAPDTAGVLYTPT